MADAATDADRGDHGKQQHAEVGHELDLVAGQAEVADQLGAGVAAEVPVDVVVAAPQQLEGGHREHETAIGDR